MPFDAPLHAASGQAVFQHLESTLLRPALPGRSAVRRRPPPAIERPARPPQPASWAPHERVAVLIAHDSPVVAAGLGVIFGEMPGVDVAPCRGEAGLRAMLAATPAPCIVFGNRRTAIDGARGAAAHRAAAPVWVCVTSLDRRFDIREAMDAGVSAYLLADSRIEDYLECLRTLRSGKPYLSPRAAERLRDGEASCALTRREIAVLRLVIAGASNQAIAEELGIAIGTVKVHVGNMLEKLGARSRTQAVALARAKGLAEGG